MISYRIAKQAERNLDEITHDLAERSPKAAVAVLDRLLTTFSHLARDPQMGMLRSDLRKGLRVFSPARPAHDYVILYYEITRRD